MSQKIQIRRGLKANVPTFDSGEPGLATDTKEVFIGTPTGNLGIVTKPQFDVHLAGIVSQQIIATRDLSITGLQSISTLNGKSIKKINIRAHVGGTKKLSLGTWSEDSSLVEKQRSTYTDATTGYLFDLNSAITIQDSGGNYTTGTIQNVTDSGFVINWQKIGTGGTGTASMSIEVTYH